MIHLLIVDDEAHWVENLADYKPWNEMGIDVVHKAYSGFEALELVKIYPIHIVLTDIMMPEFSGLELIEEICEIRKDVICILLSGYSEFEYAKQAIRLNAFEYLLKPIRDEELYRVMEGAVQKLVSHREDARWKDRLQYSLQENLPLIHSNLLVECLQGHLTMDRNWSDRASLYRIPFRRKQRCRMMFIRYDERTDGMDASGLHKDPQMLDYALINIAEELFSADLEIWAGSEEHGYIVCLLKWKEDAGGMNEGIHSELQAKQNSLLEQLLLSLQQKVKLYLKQTVSLLLTEEMSCPEEVPSYYRHSLAYFRQYVGSECEMIIQSNQADRWEQAKSLHSLQSAPTLLQLLEVNSWERIQAKLDHIFAELSEVWTESYEHLLAAGYEIFAAFLQLSHKNGRFLQDMAPDLFRDFTEGRALRSIHALKSWSVDTLQVFHRDNYQEIDQNRKSIVQQVNEYVERNLKTDASLRSIADHVHMHPTHLSKIYKLETGHNLSEHMLKIRMDKASRLLLETSMKAYEVSEEIGYLDPAYFIKVFRKCFGMTPQEYRDRKLNNKSL